MQTIQTHEDDDMKTTVTTILRLLVAGLALVALAPGCVTEDGEGGETPIDCGEHGSAHDGHCHCDEGFLFDGATCVAPDSITQVCEEHVADADADHHHGACVCPSTGTCPCEGTVETIGGKSYCLPDLHAH